MARDYLKGIEDTIYEVLATDASDNKTYTKPTIVENKVMSLMQQRHFEYPG